MKKIILFSLILYSVFGFASSDYNISITINGIKNEEALLAYYYENSKYVQDTIFFNDKGIATIKGKKNYPNGVFLVTFPKHNYKYFDLIIHTERNFSLSSDTLNFINSMKVTNSIENKALYEDLKFMEPAGKYIDSLKKTLKDTTLNDAQRKDINEKINKQAQANIKHREKIAHQYNNTFYGSLVKIMQSPRIIIPKEQLTKDDEWKDTVATVNYIRDNYFNVINFNDSGYVRSPVFKFYIQQYFDAYVHPAPDSIIKSVDFVLEKALKGSPLIYKYILSQLYDKYANSQIMGYEKILVHIADNYFINGKAPWVSPESLKKIKDYVDDIRPTLIGSPAPNFIFKDSNYVDINFHKLLDNAEYTFLVFWNSDCGHCQKEIPLINAAYDSLKTIGVQIVDISTEQTDSTFKAFVAQKCNPEWITGWDPYGNSAFRREYNIIATPRSFVIDRKTKQIKAKNLPTSDVYSYVEYLKRLAKEEEEK